jgi:hypothetical protein
MGWQFPRLAPFIQSLSLPLGRRDGVDLHIPSAEIP